MLGNGRLPLGCAKTKERKSRAIAGNSCQATYTCTTATIRTPWFALWKQHEPRRPPSECLAHSNVRAASYKEYVLSRHKFMVPRPRKNHEQSLENSCFSRHRIRRHFAPSRCAGVSAKISGEASVGIVSSGHGFAAKAVTSAQHTAAVTGTART